MAVTFVSAFGASTTGTTSSFGFDVSGSQTILFICVYNDDSIDSNVTSVTYNSVSATLIAQQGSAGTQGVVRLYYILNPTQGSNLLSATRTASGSTLGVSCALYSGVRQTSPIGNIASDVGSSATPSPRSITTTDDNSWIITANGGMGNPQLTGTGTGTLRQWFTNQGILDHGPITPAGAYTVTGQWSGSTNWASVGAAFSPDTNLYISVSDSIITSENSSVNTINLISVNDSTVVSENINVADGYAISLFEATTTTDILFIETINVISGIENVAVTDSVEIFIPILTIVVFDSVVYIENLNIGHLLLFNVSDTSSITESFSSEYIIFSPNIADYKPRGGVGDNTGLSIYGY